MDLISLSLTDGFECQLQVAYIGGRVQQPGLPPVRPEFDLRLMSWGDGTGVPTSGNNLVIVGTDNHNLLHIRIFDEDGNRVMDTDETKLPPAQAQAILILKYQLPGWLPPHFADDAKVLREVSSIVGQTLRPHYRSETIVCERAVGAPDRLSHDLAVFTASGKFFPEGILTFRTLTTEQRYILKEVRIKEYTVNAGLDSFILDVWQVLGPRISPAAPPPTSPGWPLRGG
jgi:hypothetical protein